MENEQQELLFKLSVFEQQIRQLQQQINAIEQGVLELESLNVGLDEIKNSIGKEIFAPIGRGIFVKSKILSNDLTVDIGGKNFVKKTVEETKEMIKKQIEKLEEIKKELNNNLFEIGKEAERMIGKAGD
ncbi:prefoldin subunit alpha [Candidatus Pacearchaeota archaeon]|nr:prefoldin subunit alpha [Candidatus Pacearchaeota archaeon]